MPNPGLGADSPPTNDADDDEDYYIAPQSARPFGAGLKRKRITFVPASDTPDTTHAAPQPSNPSDISSKYLSIVLPSAGKPSTPSHTCPVCNGAIPPGSTASSHESSITHQLALEHSHPPSHVDRQRKGLKYLTTYGWDPDARVGLGAQGREGIRVPVKAVEKRDTAGLGLFADERDGVAGVTGKGKVRVEEVPKMNAKQVRKLEEDKKRKAERLRGAFYREDLSRYLGPDG